MTWLAVFVVLLILYALKPIWSARAPWGDHLLLCLMLGILGWHALGALVR